MKYLIFQFFMLAFTAQAQSTPPIEVDTVCWTPTLEREDNTPILITDLSGYRIYYSDGANTNFTNVVEINDAQQTCVDIVATSVERWAVGTQIDTDGRESAYSVQFSLGATISVPKSQTGYTVTRSIKPVAP